MYYVYSHIKIYDYLHVCKSCRRQNKDEEIDIIANEDTISQKINSLIRKGIVNEYWLYLDICLLDLYNLDESDFSNNNCYVCNKSLIDLNFSIKFNYVNNKIYIMHLDCYINYNNSEILTQLFDENNYQEIIRYLVPKIEKALISLLKINYSNTTIFIDTSNITIDKIKSLSS